MTVSAYQVDSNGYFTIKDPAEVLEYTNDWTDELQENETITNSDWTITTIDGDPAPLASDPIDEVIRNGDKLVSLTLSAGTIGNIYTVYNTVTTSSGEVARRKYRVIVQEK